MTQEVDILSPRAPELAEEIRDHLHRPFQIVVRVRRVMDGAGYRIYQVRQPKNRHLVDVRWVDTLPQRQRVEKVWVLAPVELIASKVLSTLARPNTAKGLIDGADLRRLRLAFPDLKSDPRPARERLAVLGAGEDVLTGWENLAKREILPEDDEGEF